MFDFNWWRRTPVMWQGKEYENIFHLPDGGQVLPVRIVRQLLYPISSNEFLDVINAHSDEDIHMCTVCENDFLRYEYVYCGKLRLFYFDEYENFIVHEDFKKPTFKQYTDEQIIELEEFIAWIHRNKEYVISLKGRLIDEYAITAEKPEAQDSARVAEPEKKATQCQGFNLEQAKQIEIRLAKLEREQGDRIWAQDVPPLLGMSPLQFVDMMNAGRGPVSSLEEFFRVHDPKSGPFFKTSFFRDFPYIEGYGGTDSWTFHPLDILTWLKENTEKSGEHCQGVDAEQEELTQALARVAKLEEELARAQEENKRLMDENQALRLQLAEKREAGSQGVDATQVEALRKELESTKQALKTATKAPAPQAMGTYWLLLYVLFREQGIDCRTIDFSTSKTRYATDLEKKIHGIGCTLDDKTIRAKMKEVQAYMDKEKNG